MGFFRYFGAQGQRCFFYCRRNIRVKFWIWIISYSLTFLFPIYYTPYFFTSIIGVTIHNLKKAEKILSSFHPLWIIHNKTSLSHKIWQVVSTKWELNHGIYECGTFLFVILRVKNLQLSCVSSKSLECFHFYLYLFYAGAPNANNFLQIICNIWKCKARLKESGEVKWSPSVCLSLSGRLRSRWADAFFTKTETNLTPWTRTPQLSHQT